MPKDKSIKKILIIGSGPIVIGQACEFDYSGAQACKILREKGYKVILINSNPATIMTDPEMADKTYIEPITPEIIEKIIKKEKPDSLLPTLGGQTALNAALALSKSGVLEINNVRMLGSSPASIEKAEDRDLFKQLMKEIGLNVPRSGVAHSMDDALKLIKEVKFPAIIRPSFTLGGSGGNVAYDMKQYHEFVESGLVASPTTEVLIEESLLGWKEYELEVMRDKNDNAVIVCSIENIDPMGVHTGDSITVAPAQTLTDREYQEMRDASLKIMRAIGVETGGSNVQFAVNPENGKIYIIEMNPRVSRSSALASKATGFPIAKIATQLAIGYTLDEILNDITKETPVCFEPSIDYVVTKFPRFTFEKFPETADLLTVQMKSVGEAMAIGRTFKESFLKAVRSLEINRDSLDNIYLPKKLTKEKIKSKLASNYWDKVWYIAEGLRQGITVKELFDITKWDPWFLNNFAEIIDLEKQVLSSCKKGLDSLSDDMFRKAKEFGFSDSFLARKFGLSEVAFRKARKKRKITPVFKTVDTCAAEFEAYTPYLYSTYEEECEANPTKRRKVMILGGGPNRIGQGIEFDYCCVHAAFALKELGIEAIMVNCNPETVSTDYDTSDKLYFEPLTFEDVMDIVDREKPDGVIIQFGGQTPLKLADLLKSQKVPIIGTSPDAIDLAEDRERFRKLINKLKLLQPPSATATSFEQAEKIANKIGFPLLIRPSFVLGGRGMVIVYDQSDLKECFETALKASPEHPVLIDLFLQEATEIDVDAICDGKNVVIGGMMEHIEEAGIHSGDSACSLPPHSLKPSILKELKRQTELLAKSIKVIGLLNIQFAVKDDKVYLIEVNPRASRTVPFVSKTIGHPLAKIAAKVMTGKTLKELKFTKQVQIPHIAVKEAVFPFIKFPGVDTVLGPEMKSTGEVMGISDNFGTAFGKAQLAAGSKLPLSGSVFLSVKKSDRAASIATAKKLYEMDFTIFATSGTCRMLWENKIPATVVNKVNEGTPNVNDLILGNKIDLIINTTVGKQSTRDSFSIRRHALDLGITYITTMEGARAAIMAIDSFRKSKLTVKPIQDYYRK